MLVYLVYLTGKVVINTFFGKLSPLEIEGIQENSLKYLGNICLIITLFADGINSHGIIVLSVIFALKIIHWIIGLRIDAIERESVDRKKIRKIYALCMLFFFTNLGLTLQTLSVAVKAPGINILFCFEFSMLFAYIIRCIYILGVLHYDKGDAIEEKILLIFYGDLAFCIFKIIAHILCFIWTTINFRMPINLLRESLIIAKQINARIRSIYAYKILLKDLNSYPTLEKNEIPGERICLICHEEMETAKKLACQHIFHFNCLKEWLHRQQSCPICRTEIKTSKTIVNPQQQDPISAQQREENDVYEGIPVTLEEE